MPNKGAGNLYEQIVEYEYRGETCAAGAAVSILKSVEKMLKMD